jgi:hypothetical protein
MLGKTKLQSLIEKSESIVSVFEKTKNDISKINNEINIESTKKLDQIKMLTDELDILEFQKDKNQKMLTNINKFFE